MLRPHGGHTTHATHTLWFHMRCKRCCHSPGPPSVANICDAHLSPKAWGEACYTHVPLSRPWCELAPPPLPHAPCRARGWGWSRWSRGWSQFCMPSHRESIQASLRCSTQADGAALARLALMRSRVPRPSATKAVGKSRPISSTL
jgi:hypothetical protein